MTRISTRILQGDCREVLRTLPENSIDAIVTDPPYEIAFMGESWDNAGISYDPETWRACLRVLKPGGYLVSFGACRTSHRITCAIEDAGFEIRDTLQWLFSQGMPKTGNIGKTIDKLAGAQRKILGVGNLGCPWLARGKPCQCGYVKTGKLGKLGDQRTTRGPKVCQPITQAVTEMGKLWDGYSTSIKTAYEPIILARKKHKGSVAANIHAQSVGALNINGCRVGDEERINSPAGNKKGANPALKLSKYGMPTNAVPTTTTTGRWPPNVLLDADAAAVLDAQAGHRKSGSRKAGVYAPVGYHGAEPGLMREVVGDEGGVSRFFPTFRYISKASRKEREAGLAGAVPLATRADGEPLEFYNDHRTVKPIDVMRWLVRLVSPPASLHPVILDPFVGSGTTLVAASLEGVSSIGIDLSPRFCAIAGARVRRWSPETRVEGPEEPLRIPPSVWKHALIDLFHSE